MKKRKLSKDRNGTQVQNIEKFFSKKKIGLFIVLGLALLMILSIFTVSLGSDSGIPEQNKIEFNGYKFTNNNGAWYTEINGVEYGFEYDPLSAQSIKSIELSNLFIGKVYLAFDPKQFSETSLELGRLRNFLFSKGIIVSLACIKEEGCGDLPLVNCDNSGGVVYFLNGEKNEIYKQGNCVFIESLNGQEPLVVNRFMYGVLGVM